MNTIIINPSLLRAECLAMKKCKEDKVHVAKMCMHKRVHSSQNNRLRNEYIRSNF